MSKVTIIGATGSLGRVLTQTLLNETKSDLTLFSRSIQENPHPRITTVAASVFDREKLERAVQDADLVFVALSGDLPAMAQIITDTLQTVGSKRIVFITSYGIYGELPGQNGHVQGILRPYRQAADIVENSNLDYTILRPGWFDNRQDRQYRLVPKGDIIYGNNISRQAIAQVVKEMVETPGLYVKENLGIVR